MLKTFFPGLLLTGWAGIALSQHNTLFRFAHVSDTHAGGATGGQDLRAIGYSCPDHFLHGRPVGMPVLLMNPVKIQNPPGHYGRAGFLLRGAGAFA